MLTHERQRPRGAEYGVEQSDPPDELRREEDAEHNAIDIGNRPEYHGGQDGS